jgi:hypothetical protein
VVGPAGRELFEVSGVGSGEHGGASRDALLGHAVMHVGGCQESKARMMVLDVGPGRRPWTIHGTTPAPRWDPTQEGHCPKSERSGDFVLGRRPLEGARRTVRESAPTPYRPVQQLRDRHYAMLRAVHEGLTFTAVGRAFGCHRDTIWNLVRSPAARQQLAQWHAEAHRLTIDYPLARLIRYYAGRGAVRLPEGSPERARRLLALDRARLAKQRRRDQQRHAPEAEPLATALGPACGTSYGVRARAPGRVWR